jgi:hypothetical protein
MSQDAIVHLLDLGVIIFGLAYALNYARKGGKL